MEIPVPRNFPLMFTDSTLVLCPLSRLWAAIVYQTGSGGWWHRCGRGRVALAGEPPRPGPGPLVWGLTHLSQLAGLCGSLLYG